MDQLKKKKRYDHQKTDFAYEWMHFKLQDLKTANEYNSVVFKISSQFCGEKIIDDLSHFKHAPVATIS